MSKKEVVIQIFSGGYKEKAAGIQRVKKALEPVLEKLPVKKVIMGWAPDQELYHNTREFLKKYDAGLYLWLPVFSETGLLKPVHRLFDRQGVEVEGFPLKNGENFEFYCPNQNVNKESIQSLFEEFFSEIDFEGVFLDKIRFPSFVSGISGVCNCFCKACREKYEKYGIDTEELISEMNQMEEGKGIYGEVPFGITAYQKGHYTFTNPLWEKFFLMKCESVTEAVAQMGGYFRKKGLKVGLDTFAPFMAEFTGQRIEELMKQADFIKPMMYRNTMAPAGLPFEYESFLKETARGNVSEMTSNFMDIIGTRGIEDGKFDKEFAVKELQYLAGFDTPVYAGIEVNRIHPVAPVIPDYIEENLNSFDQTGIHGYVLSWDILSAPDENIDTVLQHFS